MYPLIVLIVSLLGGCASVPYVAEPEETQREQPIAGKHGWNSIYAPVEGHAYVAPYTGKVKT